MEEFLVDQHVEADRNLFLLPSDDRAADIVMNAEDFEEEIVRHRQMRADLQFGAIERNGADQATKAGLGAQMTADEDDLAGPVDRELLESLLA